MKPNFVQLSCMRGKDFLVVSNAGLMATTFCTPFDALDQMSLIAAEYHKDGYITLWTHEEASEWNLELFDPYWSSEENKQKMGYYET
jgi:hypothetical protein